MIPLTTYGTPSGLRQTLVARVTRTPEPDRSLRGELVLATEDPPDARGDLEGYRAFVTTSSLSHAAELPDSLNIPAVYNTRGVRHLRSGDIVLLAPRTA